MGSTPPDATVVKILRTLIPMTRYESPRRNRTDSISSEDLRNVWNSPIPQLSYSWFSSQARPPPGFGDLLAHLREMLGSFVCVDSNGVETVNTNISMYSRRNRIPHLAKSLCS